MRLKVEEFKEDGADWAYRKKLVMIECKRVDACTVSGGILCPAAADETPSCLRCYLFVCRSSEAKSRNLLISERTQ